jgi:hypothetical protein
LVNTFKEYSLWFLYLQPHQYHLPTTRVWKRGSSNGFPTVRKFFHTEKKESEWYSGLIIFERESCVAVGTFDRVFPASFFYKTLLYHKWVHSISTNSRKKDVFPAHILQIFLAYNAIAKIGFSSNRKHVWIVNLNQNAVYISKAKRDVLSFFEKTWWYFKLRHLSTFFYCRQYFANCHWIFGMWNWWITWTVFSICLWFYYVDFSGLRYVFIKMQKVGILKINVCCATSKIIAQLIDMLYMTFYSQIFVKIWNGSNRVFRTMGETDLWRKQKLKILCQAPFKIKRIPCCIIDKLYVTFCLQTFFAHA